MASRVDLVDRTECPAVMDLTGLTHDPDLRHYIQAQVRQLKSDFWDDTIFHASNTQGDCSCSAGASHWRLAQKIKANGAGWQDELAQTLLAYVMSHLSANIVNNIHEALIVIGPLDWKEYAPCVERQNRNNPVLVLEAAGRAIQARLELQRNGLRKCAIMGAFLNVIKQHWLSCSWFRGDDKGRFPEHKYMRHRLFLEALRTYSENPSQETLELSANALRWSLAALSCPLSFQHPEVHHVRCGPAYERLEDDKASVSSHDDEREYLGETKGVCEFPGCKTKTSSSTG